MSEPSSIMKSQAHEHFYLNSMISISNSDYALLVSAAEAFVEMSRADNLVEFNKVRRIKVMLRKLKRRGI